MKRTPKLSRLGEFGLIDRLQTLLEKPGPRVRQGIGDDGAVVEVSRNRHLAVSTDALVENIHFRLDTHPPEVLGRKAMAVNLSDLAAMGATPIWCMVALGLPTETPVALVDGIYRGLNYQSRKFGVSIIGGDTVASPESLWINVSIGGEVRKNRWFSRCGAQPGDALWVTGTLGDSHLGLQLLQGNPGKWKTSARQTRFLTQRHLDPSPRVDVGIRLAEYRGRVSSMIDISDGLVQDLNHLCRAAGVGADLYAEQIPRSQHLDKVSVNNNLDPLRFCLQGGEDYELLFTTPIEDVKKIERLLSTAAAPVTVIGSITGRSGRIRLLKEEQTPQLLNPSQGFDHFSGAG